MKVLTLLILSLPLTTITLCGQNSGIDRQVISNAGNYSVSTIGNQSLSWTLGETVTETWFGQTLTLTQGFQQPNEATLFNSNRELTLEDLGLKVFPNPATLEVTIEVANAEILPLILQVLNLKGQLLKTQQIRDAKSNLSVADLPYGTYLLRFLKETNRITVSIKLQKIGN